MKKIKDDVVSTKTRIIVKYRDAGDGYMITKTLGKQQFHAGYKEILRKNGLGDYFVDLKNGNFCIDMEKYFEDTGKVFLYSMHYNNNYQLSFENFNIPYKEVKNQKNKLKIIKK